jgi:hypothetical protein
MMTPTTTTRRCLRLVYGTLSPATSFPYQISQIEEEHRFPQTCRCLLSHKDPTRPGCVVVLFHPSTPDLWYCQVIIDNDDDDKTSTRWSWRHYSYDIGCCVPREVLFHQLN